MFGISSSRSHLPATSVAKPYLRLVDKPDESPGTAVIACLTASRSGNSELLRKAHRAARESGARLYAVFVDSLRTRFGRARVRALIDDDRQGRIDGSYTIFALMCFELWCRRFIDV